MHSGRRFDAAYYERFYGPQPVHDAVRIADLAGAVFSLAAWWQAPIRSVLDIGAGPGFWRDWIRAHRPDVGYHGVDVSPHAAAVYGHELADIATWRPQRSCDLVICQSVLQYLPDRAAAAAIATLAAATDVLLMLEVPTAADLVEVIDPDGTDLDVFWRSGDWYRRRLAPHFQQIGAGLWAARRSGLTFFELERSR